MSQPWTPPPPPFSGPATIGNHLPLAVIATALSFFFCCLPHGLVSLIFALQVDKKAGTGDIQGATNAAKQAKLWAIISIIVAAVGLVISLAFGVLGAVMSAIQNH